MLETIREFAVEQLEATGTAADYRPRHEAHYLELAERGNVALGAAEQLEWLDRLGRENDNFGATALRMGCALTSYWYISGSHTEGRGWMKQIVALPTIQLAERATAWIIGAIEAFLQGDFEPIETGLDDALRLADEDQRLVALAELLRAIVRADAGSDGSEPPARAGIPRTRGCDLRPSCRDRCAADVPTPAERSLG